MFPELLVTGNGVGLESQRGSGIPDGVGAARALSTLGRLQLTNVEHLKNVKTKKRSLAGSG
jgi:hypothetical protein